MYPSDVHVAVIGAGLAAIKSMLEEGFNVTGFERRPNAGGLWAFSENPQITSATKSTKSQYSKFLSYAKHFGLLKRIKFNVVVRSLSRTEDGTKWALLLEDEVSPRVFDKVIMATGTEVTPNIPKIEGFDLFKGRFLHSQAYKGPDDFAGQNVIVIGKGNTAGDCVVDLTSRSSKVYWSHRRGAMILPRFTSGTRLDAFASWKRTRVMFWVGNVMPALHRWIMHLYLTWIVRLAWGNLDPQWRLDRNVYQATTTSAYVFNDRIIPALRNGRVTSTASVRKIVGLARWSYINTLEMLEGIVSYSQPHPDVRPIADLYHGMFPPGYIDSLACLNYTIGIDSTITCKELASMAIAQVWAGKSKLPSTEEMESPIAIWNVIVEPHEWLKFVNETAGTGVYENLCLTLQGIRFFMREPKLSYMMQCRVNTPHIYRLFETGKRKAWDGAREAIEHVNHLSDIDLAEVKRKTA
ncbi:hypothetical protein G7Z17_g13274 [Cylindrodendrum hubeiense]|uniref:Flavin-containing monooxygenase n=1 Tax=Cylindrodendrum hubeiense TaxID=595255 RepID=A0A9P5GTX4_9HYPO|nr:hypothetical protein G7Z17_g13274 [Cylindrodendrum hubeiense]